MDNELFNIYVDKLLSEVTELTKTKVILSAQLEYQQRNSNKLNEKVLELQSALDKVKPKTKKVEDVF